LVKTESSGFTVTVAQAGHFFGGLTGLERPFFSAA
jgi:hypothetical protein